MRTPGQGGAPAVASDGARPGTPVEPHLQGLRGVAISAVLLSHLRPQTLPSGGFGVDVFFVLSGYVIGRGLVREWTTTGSFALAEFLARRARRLLPVFVVVMLCTLVAMWCFWDPTARHILRPQAVAAAVGATNIWSGWKAVDYAAPDAIASPFGHLWSLGVEEQFYLGLAILFALVVRRAPTRRRQLRAMVTLGALLTTASLVAWYVESHGPSPAHAFYFLEARGWQLLLGVALVGPALRRPSVVLEPSVVLDVLAWFGLGSLAVAFRVLEVPDGTPSIGPIVAVVGAGLVILAGPSPRRWSVGRCLSNRVVVAVGAIAYPLYLWHWPLLVVIHRVFPERLSIGVPVLALTFGFAALTHRVVERPVRWHPRLVRSPRVTATVATLALLAVVGAAGLVTRPVNVGIRPSTPGPSSYLPTDLRPSLESVMAREMEPMPACTPTPPVGDCVLGDPAGERTVMIIGDSHARMWADALDAAGRANHWRVFTAIESACPWQTYDQVGSLCRAARKRGVELAARQRPDVIVLANRLTGWTDGLDRPRYLSSGVAAAGELPTGSRLMVLGDVPATTEDWIGCLADHPADVRRCDYRPADGVDPVVEPLERELSARIGATYVPTRPWMCQATRCPLIIGNQLVYHDGDHLSTGYATSRSGHFATAIRGLMDGGDGP